jgi:cell division protein ZapE
MILVEQYDAAIAQGEINEDPQQRLLLLHFQRLADELTKPRRAWFRRRYKKPVLGIYTHGPVGGGKSYLMDLFYKYVGEQHKSRFHFHHFMQQVDAQLRRLQGQKDPLRKIAANLAKTTRLLCLDEFMVYDIADAMILAELLQALFAYDVILTATSNIPPDELYLNGLQRARFLPAIELIKNHCEILLLSDNCDYRLGRTPNVEAYFFPLNASTENSMQQQFVALAVHPVQNTKLVIQKRVIPYVQMCERVVWFKFDVICNLPRSQLDYLEISDRFDTVFLSEVPQLKSSDTTRTILLIHFIDVMYDKGVRLIISAAVPLEQLYLTGVMQKEFNRTLSRLEEMQSVDYLRRHRRR